MQSIPAVLAGRDLMAATQTGTGKTAGFALPLLQRLSEGEKASSNSIRTLMLVLVPTRELADTSGRTSQDPPSRRTMKQPCASTPSPHTLSRLKFELASTQFVKKIESTVASLLPTAGIAAEHIDTVFFTGGSSGIPALCERIAAQLPKTQAVEGDLFGSIGVGLAVDAARRFG